MSELIQATPPVLADLPLLPAVLADLGVLLHADTVALGAEVLAGAGLDHDLLQRRAGGGAQDEGGLHAGEGAVGVALAVIQRLQVGALLTLECEGLAKNLLALVLLGGGGFAAVGVAASRKRV